MDMAIHPAVFLVVLAIVVLAYVLGASGGSRKYKLMVARLRSENRDLDALYERARKTADELRDNLAEAQHLHSLYY